MTGSRRRPASRAHLGRGQALAEFALLIFTFLVLMIAVFDVGRAVFIYNSITNAVREGGRVAIVNQDTSRIVQRGLSQSALAETAAPNMTVSFRRSTPNVDPAKNDSCAPIVRGCIAVVTFETTYRPITPIISNILFSNGVTFTATTAEAVEFVCPNATLSAAQCPKQP